ncbi:phosphoribosyltransferase family protein [Fulvivirgaceae bacterium BMA12]|uniref:Phosphoribosyltransferase family protein n=1 Tax=Agaribacillus aureus TaxID=3051825 RepID=A0ABT8LDV3_9BACT|nr:phosphoribosyltransferase family protein [Fulvivirgaceae bacterium BMA12]
MIKDFFNLIFPRCCLACQKALISDELLICTHCRLELPVTNYHLWEENPLVMRFYGKITVKEVYSYLKFIKGGITQKVLHKIKYENYPELGQLLVTWFAHDLIKAQKLLDIELIVPVPLHKSRLRKRGYNQSDYIARGIASASKVPFSDQVLERSVKSESQAMKGDRLERWQNVNKIFKVRRPEEVKEKHILVVDDVLTTGATLEACAMPLLEVECKAISFATLAVAI